MSVFSILFPHFLPPPLSLSICATPSLLQYVCLLHPISPFSSSSPVSLHLCNSISSSVCLSSPSYFPIFFLLPCLSPSVQLHLFFSMSVFSILFPHFLPPPLSLSICATPSLLQYVCLLHPISPFSSSSPVSLHLCNSISSSVCLSSPSYFPIFFLLPCLSPSVQLHLFFSMSVFSILFPHFLPPPLSLSICATPSLLQYVCLLHPISPFSSSSPVSLHLCNSISSSVCLSSPSYFPIFFLLPCLSPSVQLHLFFSMSVFSILFPHFLPPPLSLSICATPSLLQYVCLLHPISPFSSSSPVSLHLCNSISSSVCLSSPSYFPIFFLLPCLSPSVQLHLFFSMSVFSILFPHFLPPPLSLSICATPSLLQYVCLLHPISPFSSSSPVSLHLCNSISSSVCLSSPSYFPIFFLLPCLSPSVQLHLFFSMSVFSILFPHFLPPPLSLSICATPSLLQYVCLLHPISPFSSSSPVSLHLCNSISSSVCLSSPSYFPIFFLLPCLSPSVQLHLFFSMSVFSILFPHFLPPPLSLSICATPSLLQYVCLLHPISPFSSSSPVSLHLCNSISSSVCLSSPSYFPIFFLLPCLSPSVQLHLFFSMSVFSILFPHFLPPPLSLSICATPSLLQYVCLLHPISPFSSSSPVSLHLCNSISSSVCLSSPSYFPIFFLLPCLSPSVQLHLFFSMSVFSILFPSSPVSLHFLPPPLSLSICATPSLLQYVCLLHPISPFSSSSPVSLHLCNSISSSVCLSSPSYFPIFFLLPCLSPSVQLHLFFSMSVFSILFPHFLPPPLSLSICATPSLLQYVCLLHPISPFSSSSPVSLHLCNSISSSVCLSSPSYFPIFFLLPCLSPSVQLHLFFSMSVFSILFPHFLPPPLSLSICATPSLLQYVCLLHPISPFSSSSPVSLHLCNSISSSVCLSSPSYFPIFFLLPCLSPSVQLHLFFSMSVFSILFPHFLPPPLSLSICATPSLLQYVCLLHPISPFSSSSPVSLHLCNSISSSVCLSSPSYFPIFFLLPCLSPSVQLHLFFSMSVFSILFPHFLPPPLSLSICATPSLLQYVCLLHPISPFSSSSPVSLHLCNSISSSVCLSSPSYFPIFFLLPCLSPSVQLHLFFSMSVFSILFPHFLPPPLSLSICATPSLLQYVCLLHPISPFSSSSPVSLHLCNSISSSVCLSSPSYFPIFFLLPCLSPSVQLHLFFSMSVFSILFPHFLPPPLSLSICATPSLLQYVCLLHPISPFSSSSPVSLHLCNSISSSVCLSSPSYFPIFFLLPCLSPSVQLHLFFSMSVFSILFPHFLPPPLSLSICATPSLLQYVCLLHPISPFSSSSPVSLHLCNSISSSVCLSSPSYFPIFFLLPCLSPSVQLHLFFSMSVFSILFPHFLPPPLSLSICATPSLLQYVCLLHPISPFSSSSPVSLHLCNSISSSVCLSSPSYFPIFFLLPCLSPSVQLHLFFSMSVFSILFPHFLPPPLSLSICATPSLLQYVCLLHPISPFSSSSPVSLHLCNSISPSYFPISIFLLPCLSPSVQLHLFLSLPVFAILFPHPPPPPCHTHTFPALSSPSHSFALFSSSPVSLHPYTSTSSSICLPPSQLWLRVVAVNYSKGKVF